MKASKYIFAEPLKEALIVSRPNRFLFNVLIDGKTEICHCPATGRIGNIVFNRTAANNFSAKNDSNIPCLVSRSDNSERKTKYTVEAISLNAPDDENKKWIGINQNRANRFIEFFIENGCLDNMIECGGKILREQTIGDSKLDFLVGNTYLEVKTPLVILPLKDNYITNTEILIKETSQFTSFDRFIKHINELSKTLKEHEKAIMVNFYMFEAEKFVPPKIKDHPIIKAIKKAIKNGVETWQINAKFEKDGVEVVDYYRNDFEI